MSSLNNESFEQAYGLSRQEVVTARDRYTLPTPEDVLYDIKSRATEDAKALLTEQPAILTPYDVLSSDNIVSLPEEQVMKALVDRALILRVLNGPERIKARRHIKDQGFSPPLNTEIPIIKDLFAQGIMPAYQDLGLGIPDATQERVSRSDLLAVGLWTYATENKVTIPYCGSSMPDCSGSPWAVASMAMCGSLAFIPRDGKMADVGTQVALAQNTMRLLDDPPFPLIEGVGINDVVPFWKSNVVGIVEANSIKALRRTDHLMKQGVTCFRIYSPEAGMELYETVEKIKKEFGDVIEIIAGMPSSGRHAKALQERGANSVLAGIGAGGICSTPRETGIAFEGLKALYECRTSGLSIPIILESGIGTMGPLLLAIGASALAKSQAIFGGTLEQPGGAHYYRHNGMLVKPYGGEASDRTRYLAKRPTDMLGLQLFREGDETYTPFNALTPTVAHSVWFMLQSLSSAMVFQRARSIAELHQQEPIVWQVTANNQTVSSVHHGNSK